MCFRVNVSYKGAMGSLKIAKGTDLSESKWLYRGVARSVKEFYNGESDLKVTYGVGLGDWDAD